MLRRNFCMPDGRLIKLSLFSTVLDKSPLTSIYFTTFEKKRKVRSPLPRQSKILVFGIYIQYRSTHYTDYCSVNWSLIIIIIPTD